MRNKKRNPLFSVLVIAIGFALLYWVKGWNWCLVVSFVVALTGLISSRLSRGIDFLWMGLAKFMGAVFPKIILSVVFYALLTPIALLSRLANAKNELRINRRESSLFRTVEKREQEGRFDNPW